MSETIQGRFTLDRARAREKLSRYQLADPYAYVLELVQSAVLRGAREIHFRLDSDDMEMRFEAEPYSAADLSHLEMAVLEKAETPSDRSRRQLAAGLLAADALHPKWVLVDSHAGARLEIKAGHVETLSESRKTTPGTLIHLRERWRPKMLIKFWQNLVNKGREQTLIERRCASSDIAITVNDKLVSGKPHGFQEGTRAGEISIEGNGFSGWGGFIAGQGSVLEVSCNGVLIESIKLDLGPLPFRAVITGPGLEKDLSGAALLRNKAFRDMMVQVEQARMRSIEKLCSEGQTLFETETKLELLASRESKETKDSQTYPWCLAKLPVWKLANGTNATFEQLVEAKEAHGFLPYSLAHYANQALEEFPVIWLSEKDIHSDMKKRLRLRNVTRRLKSLQESNRNRDKWRSSPMEPKLRSRGYLAYGDVKEVGIEGQVGIRKTDTPACIRLIKEGCLISEIFPSGWPLGVDIIVEADFQPTPTFDGVLPDQTLERAILSALKPIPELFERVAKPSPLDFFWSKPKATLRILSDYFRVLSQPSPLCFLLQACQLTVQDSQALEDEFGWKSLALQEDSPLLDVRWLKTQSGHQRSLREITRDLKTRPSLSLAGSEKKTLEHLLGKEFLAQTIICEDSETQPNQQKGQFEPDESWLEEELFLAAVRAELRALNPKSGDTIVSDIRMSRLTFTDALGREAIGLDSSGFVLLNRTHPLIVESLDHYRDEPSILLLLLSVLISTLNRDSTRVNNDDERALQEALLEHAFRQNTLPESRKAKNCGQPCGYLEPFCPSGYGTGWANDPAGLGLRFYLEEPTPQTVPLVVLDLDSPRKDGGHDFLFELPNDLLDGKRLKIWACLVDQNSGHLCHLAGSPRTFAPRIEQPKSPFGWLESVTPQGLVTGWCLDPNQPQAHPWVEFFLDGNYINGEFVGGCRANLPKPEVLEITGYQGDHGFSFQVPEQHNDGSRHQIWAYTFDLEKVSTNPLLKGAPLSYGSRSSAPTVDPKDLAVAQRVARETQRAALLVARCKGTTNSGKRCKRPPKKGSHFCYQHQPD